MRQNDDLLLDAIAGLPVIESEAARDERLRQRCHSKIAPAARPTRRVARRLWHRFVRWSLTLGHPVTQE